MKKLLSYSFWGALILLFYSCQPLVSLQIETIKPSQVNFPGAFNKIMFTNLETDFNNDQEIDTLLFNIITNEMKLGFYDGIKLTPNIDSSRFIVGNHFFQSNLIYENDTINWNLLQEINRQYGTDIIIVIDSLNYIMDSGTETNYYSIPNEFYKFRELSIEVYWKMYDIYEKKIIDSFVYSDTLIWDAVDTDLKELDKKIPSVLSCVKEVSYFAAVDYSSRIFPVWKTQTRYLFAEGNKQFKIAAQLANEGKWDSASEIWKQYVKHVDKEIASRACFNLALASEIIENIDHAIQWAQISYDLKEKKRTKYYILILKSRKSEIDKLKGQL